MRVAGGDGAIGEPGGLIRQQARRFDFGGHVRELELDGLKLGDGFAELLALLGVAQRSIRKRLAPFRGRATQSRCGRHRESEGC